MERKGSKIQSESLKVKEVASLDLSIEKLKLKNNILTDSLKESKISVMKDAEDRALLKHHI